MAEFEPLESHWVDQMKSFFATVSACGCRIRGFGFGRLLTIGGYRHGIGQGCGQRPGTREITAHWLKRCKIILLFGLLGADTGHRGH